MDIGSWLPTLLPAVPAILAYGGSAFFMRRNRSMSDLEKLVDLRDKLPEDSVEREHLNKALEYRSDQLSLQLRRRVDGAGVAAMWFIGVILFVGLYFSWFWVIETGIWVAWIVAVLATAIVPTIMLAGVPSMFEKHDDGHGPEASATSSASKR
ncbi:hypothetical protein [Citricoccus sp. K5]|uniref:hypothetical protein n=1 Tax=Citricoccus sp. K5 TaxID=2653135 RepID=UPI0012F4687C|nr:hypothetical protein [Citricoccus sp. K5]VXA92869.1 membrane hypothetical protein [Citricoccus sp. K5]VXA95352.1 membrane hypothetical protein [Citricoccus sp. K5]